MEGWTGADFQFRRKNKQKTIRVPVSDIRAKSFPDLRGAELQQAMLWLCRMLKEKGLKDELRFSNNVAYLVGFAMGVSPLDEVKPLLIQEYPVISHYLDYWRSDFPKGWMYYRCGVKDSHRDCTKPTEYLEKYTLGCDLI